MRIITIDTSTERSMVALIADGQVVNAEHLPFGLMQSQTVAPVLQELLRHSGWEPTAVDAIAVSVGPGSYTGIRVGVALAKTLAFGIKKPLIGWCALEGYIPSSDGPFAVVVDAKISGAFVRIGQRNGNQITWQGDVESIAIENIPARLAGVRTIVTPSQAGLQLRLGEKKSLWAWEERGPDPEQVCRLVTHLWEAGTYSAEGKVEIMYLRKTEAEISKEKP
jgi:tRNA threonylcarbamoyladenosine biosynthesis protein TsaB